MVFPTFFRGVCRSAALLWLLLAAAVSARAQVAQPTWQSAVIDTAISARDGAGNVYTTGKFRNTVTFGNTTLQSAGGTDVFVTKQNPAGSYVWAVRAGSNFDDGGRQLFVDDALGTVTIGGYAADTASFGPFQVPDCGFFVARLSMAGSWSWANGIYYEQNFRIAKVGADGSVYVIGKAVGTNVVIPSLPLVSTGRLYGSLVAKISSGGVWEWANHPDGDEDEYNIADLDVDNAGNVYVVGDYGSIGISSYPSFFGNPASNVYFSMPALPLNSSSSSSSNIFISKIGVGGNVEWLVTADSTSDIVNASGLVLDGLGNVLVTGNCNPGTSFNNTPFSGSDSFVAKLTTAGRWQQVIGVDPQGGPGSGGSCLKAISDGEGNIYVTGVFGGTVTLGATTLVGAGAADLFVAKLSPTGEWQWAAKAGGAGNESVILSPYNANPFFSYTEWPGKRTFTVDAAGIVTLSGYFDGPTATFGSTTLANGNSGNPSPRHQIQFSARLLPPEGGQLGGRVFVDANGNGTRDAGESPMTQPVVVEVQPGPFYLSSNVLGGFGTLVLPGNYTLSLPNPPAYYAATPATHAASFTAVGQVDTTNHFGLRPTQSSNDLRVSLTATSAFRAGRTVRYVVTCANVGTTVQPTATAALTLDPRITYQSSTPAATVAGQTLTWAVGPLAPFERRTLVITGTLPTTILWGDSVTSVATLTSPLTDLTPADNAATSTTFVIGSYDPNDKQVSARRLTPPQAAAGSWLTYTIRFQNTGNDTAFDVRILDTLRAQVQRGTVEVLAASHPMTWQLRGEGILDFRFANILLPDSGRNEAASHGFVQYRVRVQPTLVAGDSVANAADIYFDYNAPVRTNTALTRVQWPLGVGAAGARLPLSLLPNPASGWVRLTVASAVAGELEVRVFNALGQVVWAEQARVGAGQVSRRLPVAGWPAGVYQVQVRSGAQATTQRLVVQP